uniref:Cathepsin B-like protease n=1 Tax=Nilaparvata lugens TaxID=108931 RepID=Q8MNY7_NILLU|nr:cathepsin B-like protease [Nilaparvata lugens]
MRFSICLLFAVVSAISALPDQENTVREIANKWIDAINNNPKSTWKAGHNFHPDTPMSYLQGLLGVSELESNLADLDKYEEMEENEENKKIKVPKYFDARKKWKKCKSLREIRDQGNCGSCWAVSVAAAFADRLCIASNAKWNGHISSRELMSCCSYCGFGCEGGFPDAAWVFIKRHGLVTGGDYHSHDGCQPYPIAPCEHHMEGSKPNCSASPTEPTPACETTCTHGSSLAYQKDRQKGKSAYLVPVGEKQTQLEIFKNGPIVAAFKVYEDFFMYKSGVYKRHPESPFRGRHAVKVIGWGEQNGLPYWLVQNSWDYDWGDKGLFKIARGNECDFEKSMTAGLPKYKK